VIDEINTNGGNSQTIRGLPLHYTAKDLKVSIAEATGDASDWSSIIAFFVGKERANGKVDLHEFF